jgi:hypothetical protein
MKQFVVPLLMSAFFAVNSYADTPTPNNPKITVEAQTNTATSRLERSLASYLTYPEILRERSLNCVVMIRFTVNDDKRLSRLEVFSGNDRLNTDITRQLVGKKLNVSPDQLAETHLVRLHFQLTD